MRGGRGQLARQVVPAAGWLWMLLLPLVLALLTVSCGGSSSEEAGAAVVPARPLVSLLAGSLGGGGNLDAAGASARFNHPVGLSLDSAGNLLVVDSANGSIRRVSAAGMVSSVAGGSGFRDPEGVAVDRLGNIDVADTANNVIRQITPAGAVRVLAGVPGEFGTVDGQGGAARFVHPHGLVADPLGFVYVADTEVIRKIAPDGTVTTLAGRGGEAGALDGAGTAARFKWADAIAVDAAGNLYVADAINANIRKITPAGVVSTLAGKAGVTGAQDGQGVAARFTRPAAIAVDSHGQVYVADGNSIRRISPDGLVSTLAGSAFDAGAQDGRAQLATFRNPAGLTVDGAGNVVVADSDNNTLRRIAPDGTVSTLAGLAGASGQQAGVWKDDHLHHPAGLGVDNSGNVVVADDNDGTIRRISTSGVVGTVLNTRAVPGPDELTGFAAPVGLALDHAGNIFITDSWEYVVEEIYPAGGALNLVAGTPGQSGAADGQARNAAFSIAEGVAVGPDGALFVADTKDHTIRRIGTDGSVSTFAGMAGQEGAQDGTGTAARFSNPRGVAVDSAGNVYVTDAGSVVRKITPAGVVTTLAGQAGQPGAADGQGTAARFSSPEGIAVDVAGTVFVADTGNSTLRRITPAGLVSTVAGSPGHHGVVLGSGGTLNQPRGLAVDGHGTLYVSCESAVLKVSGIP